jgi:hypothetical protein
MYLFVANEGSLFADSKVLYPLSDRQGFMFTHFDSPRGGGQFHLEQVAGIVDRRIWLLLG